PQVRRTAHPSSAPTAPSATAQPLVSGLLDRAVNPRAVGCFRSAPEVRPFPSTGITRLPRYDEPVRHPSAARPVPRGRPVGNAFVPPRGLPVLPVDSPCTHALAPTPAGPAERRRSGLDRRRPSPSVRRGGAPPPPFQRW